MARVLLLDDDPLFRRLVLEVLERRGHRVVEAGTGAEATAVVTGEPVDLVIVDGALPDTNGITWIRAFRQRDRETPVIFVSSYWRDPASIALLTGELGVGLVVHKPVMPAAFGEQVESQLGLATTGSEGEEDYLEELREAYARKLPEKIAELRVEVGKLRQPGGDHEAFARARTLAHKLKGTAGSYGFSSVGERAARIEAALVRLGEPERAPPGARADEAWGELDESLHAAEQLAARAVVVRAPRRVQPVSLATAKVLVVDHDQAMLEQMAELGRQQLVDVVTARSVEQALERARAAPPDAAFLELGMPGADGSLELASALRALPGCEALPLAFMSTDGRIDNRVAAAHAGASLYLAKPVEADAFGAAVRQLRSAKEAGRPHVLLLDDDDDFSARVASVLQRDGMIVSTLRDPLRVLEALDELRPDMLILDVIMPVVSGFDVCRMLRATPTHQHLPILFLTGKTGIESRIAAFQAGADDYLAKPIVSDELLARVRVRIERSRLLRERMSKDPLTGLLLRAAFVERFTAMLSHARRHERPVTLCLLDLDHFKSVNDTRGHLAGDRVLAALGKLLVSRFRAEDLRARWGGEEFMLGFEGEPADTIESVLTRVLGEFKAIKVMGEQGEPFSSTFSAGVASAPADGASLQDLIRAADRRLYDAKRRGRARVIATD